MMWLPTYAHVVRMHEKLIAKTGGSHGVRSADLIESALYRASAAFEGVEAYPTITDKAAAIGCGLIQNHGFIDGNKRVGIAIMLLVLRQNGVIISYTQPELIHVGLSIARGDMDVPQLAAWIREHI